MNLRERREQEEREHLSPYAVRSANTMGRDCPAEKCTIRTEFQKDRDRITHCKAFRRLMHKTQVFISPEGDHYRTRLTHTLEVAQIARTIARALALNEDLTEAIALGHDLGHTPFGHTGEDALDMLLPGGFRHNEHSVRVTASLNLTREVRDGILHHRTSGTPATLEGWVVKLSDKIAYINHDVDDALRAKLLVHTDLPKAAREILGETSTARIDFLVRDLVAYSTGKNAIALSPEVTGILAQLRTYLFENIYAHQLHQTERKKIQTLLHLLFEHYIKNPARLPEELRHAPDPAQAAVDYIAGMTDRFAMKRFREIYLPMAWEA
ncbi:MAG: deoxyguanosinetriphosphate triphosphohydrolase [Defluviitaleaceae bacterium]|nr:deoxyguanosinetriphosphate triphosphohydrolase [Defluviitaleaceae bacterium]MCL2240657.1 deoxyguanosinetriphosphate triphosphohydrolase [Defluviitaleaceae bacterium]